jgi:hypothetical protein
MKERSIHAGNVTIRQLQRVVSLNTSKLYMKERSTHAGNVTIRQLQRVISLNTNKQYTKERSIHAGSVTIRQLQKVVSLDTSKLYMKERSTHVICAAIKQLRMATSRHTRIKCIRPKQYNYTMSLVLNILNVVITICSWYHFEEQNKCEPESNHLKESSYLCELFILFRAS